MRAARARASANIALAKYWGKQPISGNWPAVPSLSVTLRGLDTTTDVCFDPALDDDRIELDGVAVCGRPKDRVVAVLDRVRARSHSTARARVRSNNDFPTASGLASSASGFAALVAAAARAAALDLDAATLSDWARRASASAARSVFGGFVELPYVDASSDPDQLGPARVVCGADQVDLAVVVAIAPYGKKPIDSTRAMELSAAESVYYETWRTFAMQSTDAIREAVLAGDFSSIGRLAEASAFAMHACAMAAKVVYLQSESNAIIHRVRALRDQGLEGYVTMDAGPHVKVLVRRGDKDAMADELHRMKEVREIIVSEPGEGVRVDLIEAAW